MGWCEIEFFAIALSVIIIVFLAFIALACISARRQGGDINDLLSSRSSGADRMLVRTYEDDDCCAPRGGGFSGSGNGGCENRFFAALVVILGVVLIGLLIWVAVWAAQTTMRNRANLTAPPTVPPPVVIPNAPAIYPPPPGGSFGEVVPAPARSIRCDRSGVSFKGVVARSAKTAPKLAEL